jgi:dipeptidyl aminopeptidase/acylaminoacyl peptidase
MLANFKTNSVLIVFCLLVFYSNVCFANDKFPELKGPYLGQTPPGKTPEIFAPGIISHGFHENGIVFSTDGNELFYSTSDNKFTSKIFIYLKKDNNKWSTPGIAPFSGSYYDHSIFFSPDGKKLFFSSKRPFSSNSDSKGDLDIWVIEKDGDSWGEPINLGDKINSPAYELEPRLSPDGKYLFFTSFRTPDPLVFKGKSYEELMKVYRSPQNGYGTLYWVDAKIIEDLKPEGYR